MKKIITLVSLLVGFQANAVIIDFESASLGVTNSYSQDGFTLVDNLSTTNMNTAIQTTSVPGNTTQIFVFCAYDSGCTDNTSLNFSDRVFDLFSVDAAHFLVGGAVGTIDFVGNLFGGGTVSQTITTQDFWASYAFTGFNNLTSLDISGYSPFGFGIDNISVDLTVVPEPLILALMGLGLVGLATPVVAVRKPDTL